MVPVAVDNRLGVNLTVRGLITCIFLNQSSDYHTVLLDSIHCTTLFLLIVKYNQTESEFRNYQLSKSLGEQAFVNHAWHGQVKPPLGLGLFQDGPVDLILTHCFLKVANWRRVEKALHLDSDFLSFLIRG